MCGIAGVYSEDGGVAEIVREMLIELNHRGQESSGIAVANGNEIKVSKGKGLAETVFANNGILPKLSGALLAVGHNRYSTSGALSDGQPFLYKNIVLAHNGNLTHMSKLKRNSEEAQSDSWYALKTIAQSRQKDLVSKIYEVVSKMEGAFSFLIATKDTLVAVRDPWGFRPLVLGKLDRGFVIASETAAINAVGGKILRSVIPGEILMIQKGKLSSTIFSQKHCSHCIFELVYLERPDSLFDKVSVEEFRINCGKILARKAPVAVDAVIPVPRSGISAAIGLSEELKIPYREGLYTNPYRGTIFGHRTFIQPSGRERAASEKYSILLHVIREYPRIVLVDDSIVRGITMKELIMKLRKAGAYEIHLRIASPPLTSACHMGVDFGTRELFAAEVALLEERRKFLKVDSLVHLTNEELIEAALGNPVNANGDVFAEFGFCGACFTGKYPINIKDTIAKKV